MIVYGDPTFRESLHTLLQRLRDRAQWACSRLIDPSGSLDRLRLLLIEAGELEQACDDAGELDEEFLGAIRSFTDACATAFDSVFSGSHVWTGGIEFPDLSAVDRELRVKVPEGFAFYTLFPEQYIAAASAWMSEQRQQGVVVVIGIRSIGTTLSAVVLAALRHAGWRGERITVRPSGHPFDRRINFNLADLQGARFALVVDEGPGASGSSMAAVARGLVEAGFDRSRIGFLPGHGGEPGPHASAEVRQWWSTTVRYSVPMSQLRWGGRSLTQMLAERTEHLFSDAIAERVEDLSGGLWRDLIFTGGEPRPPAFPAFERTKFRCTLRDGRAVLWKFVGWGADADRVLTQMTGRADAGWTARPFGMAFGFVALPWIDGTPLSRRDLSPEVLDQMGRYIRDSAGATMSVDEQSAAFDRLREMLYWNTWESLGQGLANETRQLSHAAASLIFDQPNLSYGDGRLGPQEWIRTPVGLLQKVDCAGHDCDHTMIGRQPLAWDVAGAIIEWRLDDAMAAKLSKPVFPALPPELLSFYCAACAAFRVGMSAMCGVDSTFYRELLNQILKTAGECAASDTGF